MASQKQKRTWRNSVRVNPKTHFFVVFFMVLVVSLSVGLSSFLFHAYFHQNLNDTEYVGIDTSENY